MGGTYPFKPKKDGPTTAGPEPIYMGDGYVFESRFSAETIEAISIMMPIFSILN